MKIEYITGSILDSKEKYIVNQTNCITKKALGLSDSIFKKFPYADIYTSRAEDNHVDKPGKIIVCGDGRSNRYIINLLGQYYPGKPKHKNDTYEMRKKWFIDCLDEIIKINKLDSIAFPYKIGCGLAGGDWKEYLDMLTTFSNKTIAKVYIYQRPEDL